MGDPEIVFLIPAYRAAATLGPLIERLKVLHPGIPVLVVDDGSKDNTAAVARDAGAQVETLSVNRGKGTALASGLARLFKGGATWAICLDSDGQHLPEDVAAFLEHKTSDRCGIVVGARELRPRSMPWARVCSNRLTTFLLGLQAGTRLWDSQCGFRMYRLAAFSEAKLPPQGRFEWESEALVRVARAGWTIEKVRVSTVYTDAGSHIRPWRDTARFIKLWFRMWAWILG